MPVTFEAVFLDLDGVLLDSARVVAEWDRLVGDYFASQFGGAPTRWALANRRVYEPLLSAHPQPLDDPLPAEVDRGVAWVRAMCDEVGVPSPPSSRASRLWRDAEVYVCANTTAAFECARAVIDDLHTSVSLHTASGNFSWRVDALLTQLAVLDTFEVRFGPDRAGAAKHTSEFYERAFAAAGVEPARALVVDDNRHQLEIAARLGARTALVDPLCSDAPFDLVLASIDGLRAAITSLTTGEPPRGRLSV